MGAVLDIGSGVLCGGEGEGAAANANGRAASGFAENPACCEAETEWTPKSPSLVGYTSSGEGIGAVKLSEAWGVSAYVPSASDPFWVCCVTQMSDAVYARGGPISEVSHCPLGLAAERSRKHISTSLSSARRATPSWRRSSVWSTCPNEVFQFSVITATQHISSY